VVRNSCLVRIEARLDEGRGGVKDLATGETDEASSATLRARSSIDGTCIDEDFDVLRSREDLPWQRAAARDQALTALLEGLGPCGEQAQAIAKGHGITLRTLWCAQRAAGFTR
jgi:hypothetical protein